MRTSTTYYITSPEQFERRFRRMNATFDGPGFYDAEDGWKLGPNQVPERVCAPAIFADCNPHIGPSGRIVGSYSQVRDEMKRTDTVLWEPVDDRPRGLKGFANDTFCGKRGLKPHDHALSWLHDEHEPLRKAEAAEEKLKDKPGAVEKPAPIITIPLKGF